MSALRPVRFLVLILIVFAFSDAIGADGTHANAPSGRPTGPDTPLAQQVKHVFDAKCKRCHNYEAPRGDHHHTFGPDGLPKPDEINEVMDRIGSAPDEDGHMPPKSHEQLTDREKQVIRDWVAEHNPPPPPPERCQLVDANNPGDPPAGSVSDAQAMTAFQHGCVFCHAVYRSGGVLPYMRHPFMRLWVNVHKALFLNSDGTLNATQMAKNRSNLEAIGHFITVAGGHAPMPMEDASFIYSRKFTDQDRENLQKWISESMSKNLPTGCQTLAIDQPMKYQAAIAACGAKGGRVPNLDQLQKLVPQVKDQLGGTGCVWSSSFSSDKNWPSRIFILDGSTPGLAQKNATCKVTCIR